MLHYALIEVRQHLCCANVFLKFEQSTDPKSLKISVDETRIRLQNSKCNTDILVNKYFTIVAETFSNLIVDAENASFRISIQNIKVSVENYNETRDCVKINLTENDEASLYCKSCESTLGIAQKYQKIREFPSGTIDVNDFFCHHGPNLEDVLVPSSNDLFYGFEFIIVSKNIIERCTRVKEGHLYCGRCLHYLGESLFNGKAVKLWCDSICFGLKGNYVDIFSSNNQSKINQLILKAIEETSLPSPEPLLRNMHFTKVLLIASFPDRQQQYLLVHILEKHLPVLSYRSKTYQYNDNISDDYQNIELELNKAFKVFYRLMARNNNDKKEMPNWPPLLEYWQQDVNILKMTISPFLFSAVNEELNKNILLLPELYRNNNDDFLLSYIFYR